MMIEISINYEKIIFSLLLGIAFFMAFSVALKDYFIIEYTMILSVFLGYGLSYIIINYALVSDCKIKKGLQSKDSGMLK